MAYVNEHGRKPGRGVRPWLLIPKLLGVAAYFGSLVAAAALSLAASPKDAAELNRLGETLSVIFRFAAVPGLLTAIVFGLLLWLQHPKVLWRMRWLRLKLSLLIVAIPLLHLFMSTRVAAMRIYDPSRDSIAPAALLQMARWGIIAALVVTIAVIILGRHKPRLGTPVRTVAEQRAENEAT